MRGKGPHNEGSVYQRQSDGKWVAAVTLPSGRKRIAYGETEKAAIRKRRELLAGVEAGRPTPAGRTPALGQYLARWLRVRIRGEVEAGHLDAETADSYAYLVRVHIEPSDLAKVKLTALSPDDVRAWQRERLRAHSNLGKPYSARTVAMAHACLRRALNDALRDEVLARNVASLVPLPSGQSRPVVLPVDDALARVLAEMMTDRLRVLWFTMLGTGLRRGEALALRWSLVDLDTGIVRLRKQLRRRDGQLVEKDLKTEESRAALSLPGALIEMLREHRKTQLRERLAAKVWVDGDLLFTSNAGTPLDPRNVVRSWSALRDRAGVPAIRIHDLRHLAASMAFEAGASVKEIQSLLRHTREKTTSDVYVHVFESVRRATADRMDGVLRRIVGGG